jgi:hypothetical protein
MPPHLQRSTPLWQFPISLAVIGLLLMVGGWSLSIWRPPMGERAADQESQIKQIRDMSEDPELTRRLNRIRPMPPFELPGRLIVFGGIALFVVGVVRMYQAPKGPPRDEMPEPDVVGAEEHG